MIKTHGCKRCGGDLVLERDRFGSYVSCLQCGAEDKELTRLVSTRRRLLALAERGAVTEISERRDAELAPVR